MKSARYLLVASIALASAAPSQTLRPVHARAAGDIPASELQIVGPPNVDIPPKLVSGSAPVYSFPRLGPREDGFARIRCTIDPTGHTRGFEVVKASRPYFARDAITAMQKWVFQPAQRKGHPVACQIEVPFFYGRYPQ
jgi:TonB family protein